MVTTIQIDEKVKEKLDKLKMHYRETYNDLVERIIASKGINQKISRESLAETIDVLSDPETMRDIAEAMEEYEQGKFVELK